jgi:glycosyltransferase involved in cell wall biosynthesis
MSQSLSVIVPFYNEEDNVKPLFEQVCKSLDKHDFECVFVNDGSTDATGDRLDTLAATDSRLLALHLDGNFGQSAALMAGLRRAKGDLLFTLDGDLQNDPVDIPQMAELLSDHDCVFGVRVNRQDNWVRKVSSRVANTVRNAILHDGISDSGCGIKGFRRECVDHLVCFNGLHRFLAVFLRHAGFSIVECPVTHHPRQFGISKYGVNNRLWRGLYDLIGVRWLVRRYVVYRVKQDDPE